jgi:hypothetical protein
VLFDPQGRRLSLPVDLNLWETAGNDEGRPSAVRGPVDPADYGLDPLALI